jgi:hypothetical protein
MNACDFSNILIGFYRLFICACLSSPEVCGFIGGDVDKLTQSAF